MCGKGKETGSVPRQRRILNSITVTMAVVNRERLGVGIFREAGLHYKLVLDIMAVIGLL